jgi:hypothetical protein
MLPKADVDAFGQLHKDDFMDTFDAGVVDERTGSLRSRRGRIAAAHLRRQLALMTSRIHTMLVDCSPCRRPGSAFVRRVSVQGFDDGPAASRPARRLQGENVTSPHNGLPPHRYRICVRGHLGETIRFAFPDLHAEATGGDTVLTGPLADSAALHGVLAQIEALGLELLEVRRLSPV